MDKPSDVRICQVEYRTQEIPYRTPIKFGGRVVSHAVLVEVEVEVETRSGRRGRGVGAMPMGNAWAWPSAQLTQEQTLQAMLALVPKLVEDLNQCPLTAHPLDICQHLQQHYAPAAEEVIQELGLEEAMPRLAQLVVASPLEAAIFDAQGKALETNSYNLLGPEHCSADLSHYLNEDFRGLYLDRYTLRQPKERMPLYHLVGALDPLSPGEVSQPVGDGLPEHLEEWILREGLTHLKIKLAGDDLDWDVDRVLGIDRVAQAAQAQRGCAQWFYSVDFNERCESVEYVLEFLRRVKERSPGAWERIQYIEQPTHRDLAAHPENTMHQAAQIKPVVIDESLVDFESLLLARHLGYSGVALKTCKGHSEALLMAAAAQEYGMFLCVQDLTCPGRSFLHSASLAARVPTVAAIEGNARQYCPQGNRGWESRYPGMFRITDGTVQTSLLDGPGLGGF